MSRCLTPSNRRHDCETIDGLPINCIGLGAAQGSTPTGSHVALPLGLDGRTRVDWVANRARTRSPSRQADPVLVDRRACATLTPAESA